MKDSRKAVLSRLPKFMAESLFDLSLATGHSQSYLIVWAVDEFLKRQGDCVRGIERDGKPSPWKKLKKNSISI